MDAYAILTLVAYVLATVLATWIMALIARALIGRVMSRSLPLVAAQARQLGFIVIWIMGGIIIAEELGVRSDILLLVVGLFGLAAIVALREPLQNLGSRYFSDYYVPFKVGDSITVRGRSGKVVEVNPIATVLLDADENLVSIPNAVFMFEAVVNTTPHAWKQVAIPLVVDGAVDLAAFESAILKSCSKLRLHLDERFPPSLSVRSRTAQSTELLLTVMIRDPAERDLILTEINKRVTDTVARMTRRHRDRKPVPPSPEPAGLR